jgi:N6-adenosine-specific RNA methylase IME4/ParB-like chromosome segregation protein Spo0J
MEGTHFDELVASIKANGLREPIVIFEDKILDGRNRDRACAAVGVAPVYAPFRGDDPVAFVLDANLHRRHLSESQRAMVAAKLATLRDGQRADLVQGLSIGRASELLNVGERSVARAREIQQQGDPDLVRAVKTGRVKVSLAADIAALPKEAQRALLANFDNRVILDAGREIRANKAAENRVLWTARVIELSKANAPLPRDRHFPIIYADPPWKFDAYDAKSGLDRAAAAHYPTMELEEICSLPIADLATPDAALFLWVAAPHLQQAFDVLAAWGFKYTTNIAWVKDRFGQGYWIRNQHELLLMGARGNMRSPPEDARPPSIINAPKREHSRKPDEAYAIIERMYPDLPKIELFARGEIRPGWTVWGNQARGTAASEPPPDPGEMPDIPDFLRRSPPQERASSEGRR